MAIFDRNRGNWQGSAGQGRGDWSDRARDMLGRGMERARGAFDRDDEQGGGMRGNAGNTGWGGTGGTGYNASRNFGGQSRDPYDQDRGFRAGTPFGETSEMGESYGGGMMGRGGQESHGRTFGGGLNNADRSRGSWGGDSYGAGGFGQHRDEWSNRGGGGGGGMRGAFDRDDHDRYDRDWHGSGRGMMGGTGNVERQRFTGGGLNRSELSGANVRYDRDFGGGYDADDDRTLMYGAGGTGSGMNRGGYDRDDYRGGHGGKSRMQTDTGDPFGDRQSHTPIRAVRGNQFSGRPQSGGGSWNTGNRMAPTQWDRGDRGNRLSSDRLDRYDESYRGYNQGVGDEPFYGMNEHRGGNDAGEFGGRGELNRGADQGYWNRNDRDGRNDWF